VLTEAEVACINSIPGEPTTGCAVHSVQEVHEKQCEIRLPSATASASVSAAPEVQAIAVESMAPSLPTQASGCRPSSAMVDNVEGGVAKVGWCGSTGPVRCTPLRRVPPYDDYQQAIATSSGVAQHPLQPGALLSERLRQKTKQAEDVVVFACICKSSAVHRDYQTLQKMNGPSGTA
jgi:hypothetical protein